MDRNALAFLLKYSSPFSILVISENDKLLELHCPFKVRVIRNVKNLMQNEVKIVSMVKLATNNKLVFVINEHAFYYYHFSIIT